MGAIKQAVPNLNVDLIRQALKEAKDLAHALEGTATTRMHIKAGDVEVEIQREAGAVVASPAVAGQAPARTGEPTGLAAGVVPILAPLVGVFYRAASPGGKPLVQVGDTVERGQKVGIIEAMKVMNELVSDCRGVVIEILAEDAMAVAYEQRLMLINSSGGSKG